MRYWLNIHHPVEMGHKRDDWNSVCLKKMHSNTALKRISKGDIAVIYEIGWESGSEVRTDDKSIILEKDRKGITVIVRIDKDFEKHQWWFDEDLYIGHFPTTPVKVSKGGDPLVALQDVADAWRGRFGVGFNPRIYGGLRQLKLEEWQVISGLVGLNE